MTKEIQIDDFIPGVVIRQKLLSSLEVFWQGRKHRSDDAIVLLYLLLLQKDGLLNSIENEYSSVEQIGKLISKLKSENSASSKQVFEIIAPILSRVEAPTLQGIHNLLGTINRIELKKDFASYFDFLLSNITKYRGRAGGEHILPVELANFMCGLSDLGPDDTVYNPFAGYASFATFLDRGQKYVGQEIDPMAWLIGVMRIMAYERGGESNYLIGDSINDWNPKNEKYDLIISCPPFGLNINYQAGEVKVEIDSYVNFLIERGIEDLKEHGKLIALVPQRFLFGSGSEKRIRQNLIGQDLLETVIALPGGLLANTGISLAILVLNKRKAAGGNVKLIDAAEFVSGTRTKVLTTYGLHSLVNSTKDSHSFRLVPNQEIQEHQYNLSVQRYLFAGVEGIALGEFSKLIRGGRTVEKDQGKLVKTGNLKSDKLDYELDLEAIQIGEMPKGVQKINQSCVLLSTKGHHLKPTVFNYAGTPVFISTGIVALKIDESKVDTRFLIAELHAEYFLKQIEAFSMAAILPAIRTEDLFRIKVLLPELSEQKAKVEGMLNTLRAQKKDELRLLDKIAGLESEIFEQNAILRHTLAGPASNLLGAMKSIVQILEKQIVPLLPDAKAYKLSEKHKFNLGSYMEIMVRDTTNISQALQLRLYDGDMIERSELYPVELIGYLKNFVDEFNAKNHLDFTVEFEIDESSFVDADGKMFLPNIMGNTELLSILFNNLIDNANKHAFYAGGKHRVEIFISKSSDLFSGDEFYIMVSNTGKPLPDNFSWSTFSRKGLKVGPHAGNGFGGWLIDTITKRMGGGMDFFDETGPDGLENTDLVTSFEFWFPIIGGEKI